jgi:hypothetical protein
LYKELESAEHTPQRMKQRKGRTGNLSRFRGTRPIIFKPMISDSNVIGFAIKLGDLIPRLGYFNVLSWFEDWLNIRSKRCLTVRFAAVLGQSSFGR